jgi:hypothetical protein
VPQVPCTSGGVLHALRAAQSIASDARVVSCSRAVQAGLQLAHVPNVFIERLVYSLLNDLKNQITTRHKCT